MRYRYMTCVYIYFFFLPMSMCTYERTHVGTFIHTIHTHVPTGWNDKRKVVERFVFYSIWARAFMMVWRV